jgi:hypothetical protein
MVGGQKRDDGLHNGQGGRRATPGKKNKVKIYSDGNLYPDPRGLKTFNFFENLNISNSNFCKGLPYFSRPKWIILPQISHELIYNPYILGNSKNETFIRCMSSLTLRKALKQRVISMTLQTAFHSRKPSISGIIR